MDEVNVPKAPFVKDVSELKEENKFSIDLQQRITSLPEVKDKTKVDLRYPLILPYAYVHVYWDEVQGELIYNVEEPNLDSKEKEILDLVKQGIEELINLSFISVKEKESLIEYLEKNVNMLLKEFNIKLDKNSYLKIMYYIYRDFIGLNKIEPLMNDYYIEDIECNGKNSPLYIVHRRFGNIKTNIIYEEFNELNNFVEKLAQKCGKYISYATPLLDGVLPDGSRVNATFTEDVSSKGPTFTIRKFTREPWSPIRLMQIGTVSAEMLAYLWLLIENGSNILVVGGTGSGKCVVGSTPVYLSNGEVKNIKDLVEERFKNKNIIKNNDGWEFVSGDGTCVLSLDMNTLKIDKKPVNKFWRHKAPEDLIKVRTKSGRNIITTPEHPFFNCADGGLNKIRADELSINERIAVPRILPIQNDTSNELLIDYLKDEDGIYVYKEFDKVKKISSILCEKYKCNKKDLAKKFDYNVRTFESWHNQNAIPLKEYSNLIKRAGLDLNDDLKLKAKTLLKPCRLPKLNPRLFRFVALVIADGHLTKNYVEFNNSDKNLLNEFLELSKELFGLNGKIKYPKNRVTKSIIGSSVLAKILNKIFEIPYGNKAKRVIVPDILFKQDNECVSEFISGIIDCEGYIGRGYIEVSSVSKDLSKSLCTLFLRLGILPRFVERKNHFRISLYCYDNIKQFKSLVNIKKIDKICSLNKLLSRTLAHKTVNLDVIPNMSHLVKSMRLNSSLSQLEFAKGINVSRRLIGMWESGLRNPTITTFKGFSDFIEVPKLKYLAESDIFWDEVVEVQILKDHNEKYVYDLTIEEAHNFLAGEIPLIVHNTTFLNVIAFFIPPQARIVSIEDTRELKLLHENWLPSVARSGIGVTGTGGEKTGEVTLFDLLKESFRQRPDYVIVGEIRGKEAYVLFQGMASGHPSLSTMHADDVATVIRRLETPPINLSPSLVETLDAACLMTFAKVKDKETRKLRAIEEIISVDENGKAKINTPFTWDPRTNKFLYKKESNVFNEIVVKKGISREKLDQEFVLRSKLLLKLYQEGIFDFNEVQKIIHAYYKTPERVLKRFNLK